MAVTSPSHPRKLVAQILKKSKGPLTMRELAVTAQEHRWATPWRDLRRAVWAMMEDGTLEFTPEWTIAFHAKAQPNSGGGHGRAKARRPAARRTA